MKIAVSIWNQRIAPVFDVARDILLVDEVAGQWVDEKMEVLPGELPIQKVLRLVELETDTLICGAISRPVWAMVAGYGIQVFPYVVGQAAEVIQAWCRSGLDKDAFRMPGCRRRGRHQFYERNIGYKGNDLVNGNNQDSRAGGGRGQGGGGRGRGGRGQGGGRRSQATGGAPGTQQAEFCICPQCGQRKPHERGVPCTTQKCPQCGGAMTRE
jgi:predicted Fe-Mo cluster-binding NifX family protein